jgi:hypothetical protein
VVAPPKGIAPDFARRRLAGQGACLHAGAGRDRSRGRSARPAAPRALRARACVKGRIMKRNRHTPREAPRSGAGAARCWASLLLDGEGLSHPGPRVRTPCRRDRFDRARARRRRLLHRGEGARARRRTRSNPSGRASRARIARAAALYLARRPGLAAKGVRFDTIIVARAAGRAMCATLGAAMGLEAILAMSAQEDPAELSSAARPGRRRSARHRDGRADAVGARPCRRPLAPYRKHLAESPSMRRPRRGWPSRRRRRARAGGLLVGRYGYDGDRLNYDDPQNADFMAVIDRRRGLPVALGILYIHAARAAGFEATGLNTPGHFLLRIAARSGEALIDPFNGGAALERERLGAPPGMGRGARRSRLPPNPSAISTCCCASKTISSCAPAGGRTQCARWRSPSAWC